jgi:hypothetical protein
MANANIEEWEGGVMSLEKYTLAEDGRTPVVCDDLMAWAKRYEALRRGLDDPYRVALTKLPGDIKVSTVFLGLDHQFGDGPPLLFETMIFGGTEDEYCERYSTWEEAEAGHKKAVEIAAEKRTKIGF